MSGAAAGAEHGLAVASPGFMPPPGACDCHAHVIAGDSLAYPFVEPRSYTPPPAPEAAYLAVLDALGMARGVLVQISVYGTDNRYLMEVLRRHPHRLRGVAVADPEVGQAELLAMHEAGVRGLRINTVFAGGVPLDSLERLAERVAPLGWHLQLLLDGRGLPALLPRLKRLPGRFVVDHMGHLPATDGVRSPGFQALLELAGERGWWVKLSAPYRLEREPPYLAAAEMARTLVAEVPDQLVWGSDWPHVAMPAMPDTLALRNLLPSWVPEAGLRQRILVDNPARLYGFDGTAGA